MQSFMHTVCVCACVRVWVMFNKCGCMQSCMCLDINECIILLYVHVYTPTLKVYMYIMCIYMMYAYMLLCTYHFGHLFEL